MPSIVRVSTTRSSVCTKQHGQQAGSSPQVALITHRMTVAAPAELRKGPSGGWRDWDKMLDHVLGAEVAYARKLGIKHRQPARDDLLGVTPLRGLGEVGSVANRLIKLAMVACV